MEMVNGDGTWHGTYIWNALFPRETCSVTGWNEGGYASVRCSAAVPDWDTEFNEYAIEWDGVSYLALFVNGQLRCNLTSSTIAGVASTGVLRHEHPRFHADPVYLMLQTAIGGAWPGEPTPATALPALHHIDCVRVLAKE